MLGCLTSNYAPVLTPKHPVSLSSVVMALGRFFEKTGMSISIFRQPLFFWNFINFYRISSKLKKTKLISSFPNDFFWFVLAANVKKLRFCHSREKKPTHRGRWASYQYWEKNYSIILWLNNMQFWIYYREFVECHNIIWKKLHTFWETSL